VRRPESENTEIAALISPELVDMPADARRRTGSTWLRNEGSPETIARVSGINL
jgi:hypothetical protein